MRAVLVLRSVRGIAEGFITTWHLTLIGLLTSMRTQMCFQVLQPRIPLRAAIKLMTETKIIKLYSRLCVCAGGANEVWRGAVKGEE